MRVSVFISLARILFNYLQIYLECGTNTLMPPIPESCPHLPTRVLYQMRDLIQLLCNFVTASFISLK